MGGTFSMPEQDSGLNDLWIAAEHLKEAVSSLKAAVDQLHLSSSSLNDRALTARRNDADLLREEVTDVRVRVEALRTRIQTQLP
jgi:hypothetical protein